MRKRSSVSDAATRQNFQDSGLSPDLFDNFQSLIYAETGIWLGPHKTALLVGRLSKRLRQLRLTSMSDYFELIVRSDQQHERMRMIDCITTNETHFFREPRHFEFLAQRVFPRWRQQLLAGERGPRIRIWSAGCSSGEEPYSIAMMLLDHFGEHFGSSFELLATDISNHVLEKARSGIFPLSRSREIPAKYLSNYVLKGTGERNGTIRVSPEVQKLVTFARVNLNADSYDFSGSFDVVFLRNVMIYFDLESKIKVLSQIKPFISPGGYLFVGHSESLQTLTTSLRVVVPSVYENVVEQHIKGPDRSTAADISRSTIGVRADAT